jgi:hypothetical protein
VTKPWFRARSYGWGWTPASIEGWLVLALFLVLTVASTLIFVTRIRAAADWRLVTALFILWMALLAGILMVIAWATGERPRWRWGD